VNGLKQKISYICTECGYVSPKWYGKCPSCDSWNTLQEIVPAEEPAKNARVVKIPEPVRLKEIAENSEIRIKTGVSELDRVLGGGAVRGSLVLIGGEPGIGKSTLLLQICRYLCETQKVLYVSGEESKSQLKMRADRLNLSPDNLYILSEIDIDSVLEASDRLKPDILIVDSIQTVYRTSVNTTPGNISQIRECTMSLMQYAKSENVTVFIIGHVNKEGAIAGPKILEHMVDCVLYIEGEKHISYRVLRSAKNRFGSTNEIGVFEMRENGLVEVENPSATFLAGRPIGASGTCVTCVIEGSRPLLAEVQALITRTSYGTPRRTSAGIDYNRAALLLAVIEKIIGLPMSSADSFINVIGGLRVDEPAADLSTALAIYSSFKDAVIPEDLLAIGEIGLTGELRSVGYLEQRIAEAARMGFKRCIIPNQNTKSIRVPEGFALMRASKLADAIGFITKISPVRSAVPSAQD